MKRALVGSIAAIALLAVAALPAHAATSGAPRSALKLRVLTGSGTVMLGAGRLLVRVRAGRPGRVALTAHGWLRRGDGSLQRVTLGAGTARFGRAGTKRARLKLASGARALLRLAIRCRPVRVAVTARARGMTRTRAPRQLRGDPWACASAPGVAPGGTASPAPPSDPPATPSESPGGPPAPPEAAPVGEWFAGDLHVHTTYSHDSYGGPGDDNTGPEEFYTLGHTTSEVFTLAATRGLDYLGISDHNDIRAQSDPGWGTGGVLGLPSYENSLKGHAQMLGATKIYDTGNESVEAVKTLADALRADGGVFQANHPADAEDPGTLDWSYAYDVLPDVVEGWNLPRAYQQPFPSGGDK
jgi:hypothetical protein